MKISLNWIKDYIDINLSVEDISTLLTDIGLEVESVEKYQSIKGGLSGLVVGEVLEKTKHPDADKLSVCQVDVGNETLQIVCGAPNVDKGQKVVVALVGSTVYPTKQQPFDIKKAKIRGVESYGMICAEDEIGVGENHEGILVLPENIKTGTNASAVFEVYEDVIFEIGLTPNRSDAHSQVGVARDLLITYNFRNNLNNKIKLSEYQIDKNIKNKLNFTIEVENKQDCLKYYGVLLEGIVVQESPNWLKNRLKAIGQKPINNVVDVTNYVMHELGQPLHAFDIDACTGNKIVVKNVPNGTIFKTLDKQDIKLTDSDLMICNAKEPMCIAGVFGGLQSGVKPTTTSIFLESAYFNPKAIRKSSTFHQLRTEAAIHFEKGIDPNITEKALCRAVELLVKINSSINIISPILKIENKEFKPFSFNFNFNKVKKIVGHPITDEQIRKILTLLEIKIDEKNNLEVPCYRVDVQRDIDVIEEILRIYGLNNIPIPPKVNASPNLIEKLDKEQIYNLLAIFLSSKGFNEIMTNPLTKSKWIQQLDSKSENWVKLLSSINVELDVMRNTMLFSTLETLAYNINHKINDLRVFELGKTYHKHEQDFVENEVVVCAISGNIQQQSWKSTAIKSDFYDIKSTVDNLLFRFGVQNYDIIDSESTYFEYSLAYQLNHKPIAQLGKIDNHWTAFWGIKQEVYYAEINWNCIVEVFQNQKIRYKPIAKFPSIKRDLALLIDKNVKFLDLKLAAQKKSKQLLKEIDIFDIYRGEELGKDKQSYALSFTFSDENKTLTDKEIDEVMTKLVDTYTKDFKAILR